MRTFLIVASLLLAPIAFVPVAAAGDYCGEDICCRVPDPSGSPGSILYFVTDTYENAVLTGCATVDRSDETAEAAIEFVVDCLLGGSC